MFKKLRNGFLWGVGFSLAIVFASWLVLLWFNNQSSQTENRIVEKEELDQNFDWYKDLFDNSEDDIYGYHFSCLAWATENKCTMQFKTKYSVDLIAKERMLPKNCAEIYSGFIYAFGEESAPRKEDILCYSISWQEERVNLAVELNRSNHYIWQFSSIQ